MNHVKDSVQFPISINLIKYPITYAGVYSVRCWWEIDQNVVWSLQLINGKRSINFPVIKPAFSGNKNKYNYSGSRQTLPHFPFDTTWSSMC